MTTAAAAALVGPLHAQGAAGAETAFPSRPVRVIVPAAPGGTLDIIVRTLAPGMSEGLGQVVVVENRATASTTVAEEYVARATPDGHTMFMAGTSRATNPHLYAKLSYDPLRDLTSVSLVATSGNALVTGPATRVTTVRELIELAKSRPGELLYGTAAHGSSGHLAGELFNQLAGTKLTRVPYRGAAPALVDLLGGQIHMTFDNIPVVIPHVRAGRLRALGVTSATRSPLLPDVPTIAEAGLSGYEVTARFGLTIPAKTPKSLIARLNAEVVRALGPAPVKERFAILGLAAVGSSPEEYQRVTIRESERLGKLIKEAGIKPQ
ncbi:MAG: Bug family tripartite tricarboxylate transporter substrate binding protein [Burkholderiales bacterium]